MLKRLSFIISMPFTGVLLVMLIVILAIATFIESAYGTQTAWAVIYGTHWFELLLLVIGINLTGVMIKQKFYRRKKLVVFTFHLAFILILAGAAITRFISFEGNMHIRENGVSNSMLSNNAWINVVLQANGEQVENSKEVRLSDLTQRDYRMRTRVGGEKVKIMSTGYLSQAIEQYVSSTGGDPYLQLMVVTGQQTVLGMPSGSVREVSGLSISFNDPDSTSVIQIVSEGEQLYFYAPFSVSVNRMGGGTEDEFQPGDRVPLLEGALYDLGGMRLVLQNFLPSARKQVVRAPAGQGGHLAAVRLEIHFRGMITELFVPGLARLKGDPVEGTMGDLTYTVTYGSREIPIPFSLFLKDFQVERYPGSQSPSSFASEVVLIDNDMGIQEDRRIFMNNVLKHRGYRFYQSSYDNDEMGTILSVNKDRVGTLVTYLGYLVLIGGMFLALFTKGTRFAAIASRSLKAGKMILLPLILMASTSLFSQEVPPRDVAEEFGYLWVQDKGGRFEPMNTLGSEVVRKVTGKARYEDYSSDQVLLGMLLYPEVWQLKEVFEIKHPELQRITGYKGEMVSFSDLMDETGNVYLLNDLVDQAYSKEVPARTELDKEVIKLDDRISAMYLVQSGSLLNIFPDPGAENHRWASVSEALMGQTGPMVDSMSTIFLQYMNELRNGNYGSAGSNLVILNNYQLQNETLLPTHSVKKLEIRYNRVDVFPKLFRFYLITGILLMVLQFLIVFKPRKLYDWLSRTCLVLMSVAFLLHTLALAVRWYISGHAPMSNGYESMILVSWVTVLAGLIFTKRSGYVLALTAILAALALLVAGMSNMNPEITNLVPVLKSPWLTIHVTVIMAGYGFLGLASIMGLMNLVFYVLLSDANKKRMKDVITQLTDVNHLTLIVGLYFMTAGVFLGGVWANESWGRYWGWDPKETWALITVLVYAFVSHMHKIPGLRGQYAYNLASFIAYSSVLMTYFGVNYFLGGMHSYASGLAFSIPWWIYLLILIFTSLSILAFRRQQKLLPEVTGQDE